ncbi:MAG: hypothetical protein JSV63_01755 [Candidatus Aenigmatarchaeota archaeon]|nr:MAG: hypothetical protein JSV63_01755 [Candidatus Aenigmarchaeota archaeon]
MIRSVKAASLIILLALLLLSMMTMRPFGVPADTSMDDYFISNSQQEISSNNVVTAVLFDYRGLDTLGEASILFAAATGVFLVFRRSLSGKR